MQLQRKRHDNMELATNETHVPFNADLVRSKGVDLSHQLTMLAPLADCLVEQVGVELAALTQLPVKVTLSAAKSEKLGHLTQIEAGYDIVSTSEAVSCWSVPDIEFDRLMGDICLGGTGTSRADSDAERPPTAFDKKLRALIDERIATAAARALSEISEHADLTVRPRARMAARKAEGTRLCYSIRLLLNVFDQACEFELRMSFSECLKLIGGEASSPASYSAASLMEKTPFCIEVFLKPDVLDIRQILNLTPGEVLKLNVSASTPVELKLNGTELSRGNLRYDKNGGHIRLLDATLNHSTDVTQRFAVSGLSNGN
jgi:flagellar motor switch/type III secretory pathway protein FliN